jgi:hypothetical protein
MKIQEYKTNDGGKENPCELVSAYMLHEKDGGTLQSWLEGFEFDTRDEIERAIRLFIRTVTLDEYMRKKHLPEDNPYAAAIFTRYSKIMTDANRLDKYPVTLSGEIWHGGFSRKRLEQRTADLFKVTPDAAKFAAACERVKKVYSLGDTDVEKIHFFVEQVKAGEKFPNSLRRMLYIWGSKMKTGKTTSATMLVSLLNGDTDEKNIARYSSTLATEMQVKSFAVPKISECNAVLMDECFFADMGKMYADFKRFITSSNGRARLPYGQEFEWTGQPNYIATSNDSLQKFIKDWSDRRYLSVEFKERPTENLNFAEIKQLWADFVLNSTRTLEWSEWAEKLAPAAEEKGDRTEIAEELEIDLRKLQMLERVLALSTPSKSPACAQNHVALKTFVDWFSESMGVVEAHKRKAEIEAAVVKVYGPRYSTTNYWLLTALQDTALGLKNEINNEINNQTATDTQAEAESAASDPETNELPF